MLSAQVPLEILSSLLRSRAANFSWASPGISASAEEVRVVYLARWCNKVINTPQVVAFYLPLITVHWLLLRATAARDHVTSVCRTPDIHAPGPGGVATSPVSSKSGRNYLCRARNGNFQHGGRMDWSTYNVCLLSSPISIKKVG